MAPSLASCDESELHHLIKAKEAERDAAWGTFCDQGKRVRRLQEEAGQVIAQHCQNFGEAKNLEATYHRKEAELFQLQEVLSNSRRRSWSSFGVPHDLLVRVLSLLPQEDLAQAGVVCRDWHTGELAAWEHAGRRDFASIAAPREGAETHSSFGDVCGAQEGPSGGQAVLPCTYRDEYRWFKSLRWGERSFQDLCGAGGLELQHWRDVGEPCQLQFGLTRHAPPHEPLAWPPPGHATAVWKRTRPKVGGGFGYNALAANFVVTDVATADACFKMLLPTNRGGNTFVGVALLQDREDGTGGGGVGGGAGVGAGADAGDDGNVTHAAGGAPGPSRAGAGAGAGAGGTKPGEAPGQGFAPGRAAANRVWVGFCPAGGQVACGSISLQGRITIMHSLHRPVLPGAEDADNTAVGVVLSRGRLGFFCSADAAAVGALGAAGAPPPAAPGGFWDAGGVACTGWVLDGLQGGVVPVMALCDTNDSAAAMAPSPPEATREVVDWMDRHSKASGVERADTWHVQAAGQPAPGAPGGWADGAGHVEPHTAPVESMIAVIAAVMRRHNEANQLAAAAAPPHGAVP